MHSTVTVSLAGAPYDVAIGDGLLSHAGDLIRALEGLGKTCALVTDSNVGPLFADALLASLADAGFQCVRIEVPAGEPSKSLSSVEDVCRRMIAAGLDRKAFVVALGGGVVGDLAGFAAAVYYRGIPLIQVPTTIVAQVDSSVGGKTGVNTPEGKNLVGAFHQPALVIADPALLKTLPDREYHQGFAEIIKHAAIRDPGMFEALDALTPERENLAELIARNVRIKAEIVAEDEKETRGTRALLNFGHTIGHGIEAAAGYHRLLHGEAISLGLIAAANLSRTIAGLESSALETITERLRDFELPLVLPPGITTEAVLAHLARDKKFQQGAIRFVLLRALGDAFVSDEVTLGQIEQAVEALRQG